MIQTGLHCEWMVRASVPRIGCRGSFHIWRLGFSSDTEKTRELGGVGFEADGERVVFGGESGAARCLLRQGFRAGTQLDQG